MKLKSKTIIYELEDGTELKEEIKEGEKREIHIFDDFNHPIMGPSIETTVTEMLTKPQSVYRVYTAETYGKDCSFDYYLNKQEAIKAAEDYLEGK